MEESVLEIGFWSASQFVQVQVHAQPFEQTDETTTPCVKAVCQFYYLACGFTIYFQLINYLVATH